MRCSVPAALVIAAFCSPSLPATFAANDAPQRNAYFGNVHIHTSYSFDAYTNGSITEPSDAYDWAKGKAIPGGGGGGDLKIRVPLDFYAVSDHAEYMGVFRQMQDPKNPLSKLPIAERVTSDDKAVAFAAFAEIINEMSAGKSDPHLSDPKISKSVWKEIVEVADRHYEPGKFTTFPAFEWTSNPNKRNLHRVVVFRDSKGVPELAFSALDSDQPAELWKWMDRARSQGATVLAIPHNANASDGLMFSLLDSAGNALGAAYSEQRMRNEPLYEVSQIKGTSETHPDLSPNDEFAGFEQWDYTLSADAERPKNRNGSFARQAYLDGLSLWKDGMGNPFQFGLIGDSDTHNSAATIEEDNYTGKFALENSPKHRLEGFGGSEAQTQQVREFSSGGVAGVWAETNTREAIFDAMARKETFGTSGPRMHVRFFGGWTFGDVIVSSEDLVKIGYQRGVPMGGQLLPVPDGSKAPSFLVWAIKDANSGNLDRIQVIKGWVNAAGKQHEKVYDVVWSGDRKIDPGTGRLPAVGNTVDVKKATYQNTIGSVQLSARWADPEFDPKQPAFYYARVLEIPTPRWSTYDATKLGIEIPGALPASIQERAWTSPIWYKPRG